MRVTLEFPTEEFVRIQTAMFKSQQELFKQQQDFIALFMRNLFSTFPRSVAAVASEIREEATKPPNVQAMHKG